MIATTSKLSMGEHPLAGNSQAGHDHAGRPETTAVVQNVDPYANPGHILAPPRHWVEALRSGQWSNAFFRLRYKSLLRRRMRAEPERIRFLLEASERSDGLLLGCNCGHDHCHTQPAAEFLEDLREQGALNPAARSGQAGNPAWRKGLQARMVMATLTEAPPRERRKSA